MILEIRQTTSNGRNAFDIMNNGELMYKAESAWLPGTKNDAGEMYLTDFADRMLYRTDFAWLDNIEEALIPYKYLLTGAQKFAKFGVLDERNNDVGSFYVEANGIADKKICMEYGGRVLMGYRRSIGDKEFVSFYDGETQVGQLTKSNRVVNNMDSYVLHFIDGFEAWTPLLAFFTVYYDFLYYNHAGEYGKVYKVKYNYSINKNMDKYNHEFILNNFGAEEVERMEELLKVTPMVGGMTLKTFWIVFAAGWGISLAVTAIILAVVFL